jgi:hypothetical protein
MSQMGPFGRRSNAQPVVLIEMEHNFEIMKELG